MKRLFTVIAALCCTAGLRLAAEDMPTATLSANRNFSALVWKNSSGTTITPDWTTVKKATINVTSTVSLTFDQDFVAGQKDVTFFFTGKLRKPTLKKGSGKTLTGLSYNFTNLPVLATFTYDPDPTHVTAGYVRYALDMGTRSYKDVLVTPGGTYQFQKIIITGDDYDYHDRTVEVASGDVLKLQGDTTLSCGLSLNVLGGTVSLGREDGYPAICYGRNGTVYKQSGGTVTVYANGTAQEGTANGFVLSCQSAGGGCHSFTISDGNFYVPNSSINFYEATNTITMTRGTLRAQGVFSSKANTTGRIVMSGGKFELGSLGWKAGSATLKMSGGTFRTYETGVISMPDDIELSGTATISASYGSELKLGGVISGTGKLVSSEAGKLTLSGANTYSGGTDIGMSSSKMSTSVEMGSNSALGSGPVNVYNGATLDFYGHYPTNLIQITGVGVSVAGIDNVGAIMNSGAPMTVDHALNVKLNGAAKIGCISNVLFGASSSLNLNGSTLTVATHGDAALHLATTVQGGGGTILVSSGCRVASAGKTVIENGELQLRQGILDLSKGTSFTCSTFTPYYSTYRGRIVGSAAKLIVTGTFDARKEISVPNLHLADGATLQMENIVYLTVTEQLTFGGTLNVTTYKKGESSYVIAKVPETTLVTDVPVVVNSATDYALYRSGSSLYVDKSGDIWADVRLDSATGWTNFETMKVCGTVRDFQGGKGTVSGQTNLNIVVTAGDGTAVTQKFAYAVSSDGSFDCEVQGVAPGNEYVVSAFVTIENAGVHAQSEELSAYTSRQIAAWIDEDADTFSGRRTGTGHWYGAEGLSGVSSDEIVFSSESWDRGVTFDPTNAAIPVASSYLKELHFTARFERAGFFTHDVIPDVPNGLAAAVTFAQDASENGYFAVATNGAWQVISRDVFEPELDTAYEFVVCFNHADHLLTYDVVSDGETMRIASCPLAAPSGGAHLEFYGSGSLRSVTGMSLDTHLLQVEDAEYAGLDEAHAAAGVTKTITPLWRSSFDVSDANGELRVLDDNVPPLLDLTFKKWHHCTVDQEGAVTVYRYLAGNNWLEYADSTGVVPVSGGWRVTNECGLAWLAETATNQWLSGCIELGNDLDLSARNWTPIAHFTGSFDGRGHVIAGLNNTNVVAALGACGSYPSAPANDWGYTAYGLFGCTTNAHFRNVALADVAISNAADSVAALLGVHAGGALEIVGVTNASGVVCGTGRAVAGLATIGGAGEAIGAVTVTGNVNRATLVATVSNSDDGGNVAQILAGTTWETRFADTVVTTNNVGEGLFDVTVVNHEAADLPLPTCNLAAAVMRTDADFNYWQFFDANDASTIPVDPVRRTARLSAGVFQDGSDNVAGWWIDTISAMEPGKTLYVTGSLITNDVWQTVVVDRSIGLDLKGNSIYTVLSEPTFRITDGACLSISNGTILVPQDVEVYDRRDGATVSEYKITIVRTPADFYDRTVFVGDTMASLGEFLPLAGCLPSGTVLEFEAESGIAIDVSAGTFKYQDDVIARLPTYRSLTSAASAQGGVAYEVTLNDRAIPGFDMDASAVSPDAGTAAVVLSDTHAGLYYAIQRKTSLVEKWIDPQPSEWKCAQSDGEIIRLEASATGGSGFYRVCVSDHAPTAD